MVSSITNLAICDSVIDLLQKLLPKQSIFTHLIFKALSTHILDVLFILSNEHASFSSLNSVLANDFQVRFDFCRFISKFTSFHVGFRSTSIGFHNRLTVTSSIVLSLDGVRFLTHLYGVALLTIIQYVIAELSVRIAKPSFRMQMFIHIGFGIVLLGLLQQAFVLPNFSYGFSNAPFHTFDAIMFEIGLVIGK